MKIDNWTSESPKDQGLYWHWDGDPENAPVALHIGYSWTTEQSFVEMGQMGITTPQLCDEREGWWQLIPEPLLPNIPPPIFPNDEFV